MRLSHEALSVALFGARDARHSISRSTVVRLCLHLAAAVALALRALLYATSGHALLGAMSAHISVFMLNLLAVLSVRLGPGLHMKLLMACFVINVLIAMMHLLPLGRSSARERLGALTGLCLPALVHAGVSGLCIWGVCHRGPRKVRQRRVHEA